MSLRFTAAVTLIALVSTAALADEGQSLYAKNCGNCHAPDGAGRTNTRFKLPDLRSTQVQSMSDAELYESIARGTKHREYPHAYEMRGLTKPQIQAMVAHIRTLKK